MIILDLPPRDPAYAVTKKTKTLSSVLHIASYRSTFQKSYKDTTFTREIFEIVDTLHTRPPTYKIKDLKEGELIEGTFYEEELQRVRTLAP